MAVEINAGSYPVYFAASEDNTVARWRPLVHWLMVIPHLIIGYVLIAVASIVQFICWFIIIITGKMPEGMANFIIMTQRYWMRTGVFYLGLSEQYPPFEFATTAGDPGDYSVRLDVTPQLEGRNRLTVLFRFIMIIPLYIFLIVVGIGAYVVMILAWFAVLITGKYPVGMRSFVLRFFRFSSRFQAYSGLLVDQYPPFSLD